MAEVEGHAIYLERGWLWGEGHGMPVQVETGDVALLTEAAHFALEYLPGRQGWLYVLEGTVDVMDRETGQEVTVSGGQMRTCTIYDEDQGLIDRLVGDKPLPRTT